MIPDENTNTFDFDKFLVKADEEAPFLEPQIDTSTIPDEPFSFDKYVAKEPASTLEQVGDVAARGVARLGSRVGETVLGFPGDFRDFSVAVGDWLDDHVPVPEFLKGKDEKNFAQKFSQTMLDKLPTSAELKEKSSEITGGFTDPQGVIEEFGDDVFEFAALLYGDKSKAPAKASKIVSNFTKALGKATIAKGSGEIANIYGAGPGQKLAAEMGALGLMSFVNAKMADKFVSDKFTNARKLIPKGSMADTKQMTRELSALEGELSKGISTPTKNEVKQAVSEMKSKVSGGAYPAEEIVDMMHDLNERMTSKKLFDELGKSGQKQLKFRYNKAKNVVGKEIANIGKQNPEFIKEWSEGMEGFAAIQNSKKATRTIEKLLPKLPQHVLLGVGVEALLLQNPKAAVGLGAGFATLKSAELLNRVMSSPALRKHYLNVIEAATKENAALTAKGIATLDRELKKDISKDLRKKS